MADRTIYVGNVDAEVDEPTMRAVFENCGFVTQVRIAGKKGYNTVYCFVEFAEISQAQLALAMDGLQLGERQIKVSMAKITPQRLAQSESRISLREKPRIPPMNLLQAQAQARLLTMQPAFNLLPLHQHFAATQPLLTAPLHLPPSSAQPSRAKRPHQDPDKVDRTIYIENVAEDIHEQALADHFGVCGLVTAVRIAGSGPGLKKAWVEFDSHSQARAAREYDQTGLGSAVIRVRPSKTAIHTNGLLEARNAGTRSPAYEAGGYSRHRSSIPLRRGPDSGDSPPLRRRYPHSPNSSYEHRGRDSGDDYRASHHGGGYDSVYARDGKRMRV